MDCPSTPEAPLLASTCLYASHTNCFDITNGLSTEPDLPTRLLPGREVPVARANTPCGEPTPSLHPITGASSLLRVGPPAGAASVLSVSGFRRTTRSLSHTRALQRG